MSLEPRSVPKEVFASLDACFVEGDALSEKRFRRIKHRAVALSVILQSLALTALILFPLLSKGERLSVAYVTPIPPYAPIGDHRAPSNPRPRGRTTPQPCHVCPPRSIPPTITVHDATPVGDPVNQGEPIPGVRPTPGTEGGRIPTESHPVAPPEPKTPPVKERRSISELQQMAQLIHRVDPVYPPLARQIHREGRVELHAIISTEGTVESLQVLSGDPLLIQSALAAVREWRYRPTILDRHPIEVDTHITVIYTLGH